MINLVLVEYKNITLVSKGLALCLFFVVKPKSFIKNKIVEKLVLIFVYPAFAVKQNRQHNKWGNHACAKYHSGHCCCL